MASEEGRYEAQIRFGGWGDGDGFVVVDGATSRTSAANASTSGAANAWHAFDEGRVGWVEDDEFAVVIVDCSTASPTTTTTRSLNEHV